MALSHRVLRFLSALKKRGTVDPLEVERLEQLASRTSDDAHVALVAAQATECWEAQGTLASADDESDLVKLEFPEPIEVLGYICSVSLQADPGAGIFIVPSLQDVMVSITVNRKEKITQAQQLTTGGDSQNFITLAALNLQPAHAVRYPIYTPSPVMDFTFRWRAGANVWPGVFPNVAVAFRYCVGDDAVPTK